MSVFSPEISRWLHSFERAVRERNIDAGRALFAPDARGFGSVAAAYGSLDALETEQWRRVWPVTEEFAFDLDALVLEDQCFATIATTWSSIGFEPDGSRFRRRGRATLVLHKLGGTLRCVHSHFSLTPGNERVLR